MNKTNNNTNNNTALLMPGGGARAAYQTGVIKALGEMTRDRENYPFPILSGTSAGALNAVVLGSTRGDFYTASLALEEIWSDLRCESVYRSDWLGLGHNIWRLLLSLVNAGIAVGRPVALLDNLPLKKLLREKIDFSGISDNLQNNVLQAVCVTAMNYTEGVSVSFFQGGPSNAGWQRWRRQGIPTPLQLPHLMASAAIPTVFPPQRIGRNYYGDGALRQLAPVSPVVHLGADKVLIIGTTGHKQVYEKPYRRIHSPSFGQIIGHLLNSAFIDSLESDIELLEQLNDLMEEVPLEQRSEKTSHMQPIDIKIISPSIDIDTLAEDFVDEMPRSIRTFLKVTGSSKNEGGVNVASFLLFTEGYCGALMELGYRDAMTQKDELLNFLDQ